MGKVSKEVHEGKFKFLDNGEVESMVQLTGSFLQTGDRQFSELQYNTRFKLEKKRFL